MSATSLAERLLEAFRARARATWGARVYGQRRGVLDLARLLIRHLVRCSSKRVGLRQDKLARLLSTTERTVKRWLHVLRELGLLEVVTVLPGERAYDGAPARRMHLEYELSDELRRLVSADDRPPDKPPPEPEPTGGMGDSLTVPGANMSPDPLDRSKKNLSRRAPSVPNLSASPRGGGSSPPRPTLAKTSPRPPDRSKRGPGSLEEQAIRQHRRLTDPSKGERVPIADDERRTVAPFLAGLDGTPEDKLRQAAAVSRLALQDSRGRPPTLGFTYGHPPDKEPGHYGRVRLARLRERKHDQHKSRVQRGAQALARALFGQPPEPKSPEQMASGEMVRLGSEIMETLRPSFAMQSVGRRR